MGEKFYVYLLVIAAISQPPAEANLATSTITLTLTLCSLNDGVSGIFRFFRGRGKVATTERPETESLGGPSGPVSFDFLNRRNLFSNPFEMGSNLFSPVQPQFSGYDNFQRRYLREPMPRLPHQAIQNSQFYSEMERLRRENAETSFSQGSDMMASMSTDEAESFFALLSETDEGLCISRLVCEMGADPVNTGEFGQSIADIISGLRNFEDGSKASYFSKVMQTGMEGGLSTCASRFSSCDDESLNFVKNAQLTADQDS